MRTLYFISLDGSGLTREGRFCGLTRAQQTSALTVLRSDAPNWVYQYAHPAKPGKWTQILPEVVPEDGEGDAERGKEGVSEPWVPLPRYAHQVVYDERTKKVYMHGGNAGEGRGLGGEEKENEEARAGSEVGARSGEGESGDGDGGGNSGWTGGGTGGEERSRPGLRETRLDDFWVMNLVRCVLTSVDLGWVFDAVRGRAAPEEVIRRAKYLVRRQRCESSSWPRGSCSRLHRFREMCEEQPAVKALRYLQTEVSDVVDHTNPEETSVFRSLLAHLLVPSALLSVGEPSIPSKDVVEREEPPKKRSRPNTPDEVWTNVIDGEDDDGQQLVSHTPPETIPRCSTPGKRSRTVLQMDEDPVETRMREQGRKSVSAERFSQRTEMFESLLAFVGEEVKQPKGSLLDLVDAEDGL